MIITGEKLNSSIPSVFKTMQSGDKDELINIIKMQAEFSDYLDINTALCQNEAESMKQIIGLVMETTECGLMPDSPNPRVIEEVLPFCRGRRVIVNSVTPDRSINELIPLLAGTDYGVVALPVSAEQTIHARLQTAERLASRLVSGNIKEKNIYIDALAEAASFDPENAGKAIELIRLIKKELPNVRTTLGVSNISYGLPGRQTVNKAFLACAVYAGLDMAIIDAASEGMLDICYAARILSGEDEYGIEYIERIREKKNR